MHFYCTAYVTRNGKTSLVGNWSAELFMSSEFFESTAILKRSEDSVLVTTSPGILKGFFGTIFSWCNKKCHQMFVSQVSEAEAT